MWGLLVWVAAAAGGSPDPAQCVSNPGPKERHVHRARIFIEDTDAGGIVFYANYLRFFERAVTEYLGRNRVAQLFADDGILLGIEAVGVIKYGQPARLGDEVEITTTPYGVDFAGRLWVGAELARSGAANHTHFVSASPIGLRFRRIDGSPGVY